MGSINPVNEAWFCRYSYEIAGTKLEHRPGRCYMWITN